MPILLKRSFTTFVIGLLTFGAFAVAVPAMAATDSNAGGNGRMMSGARFASSTTPFNRAGMMRGWAKQGKGNPQNLLITGDGQPIVGGTVTVVTSSTLTIKNTGNVTYTVDTLNAVIVKGNATSTLSSIAVGDAVVIQGAVNGTSITATTVIDQGAPKVPGNSASTTPMHRGGGFFNAIGGFFSHLFGFF